MVSITTLRRVTAIAEQQWGLVTRRQSEQAGVARATLARIVRSGLLRRVADGVYRVGGAPTADHVGLRAAWLQLAPPVPARERSADQGVVSHRSAAAFYGIGGRVPDRHDFLVPRRRQSRRRDVRFHVRRLSDTEWVCLDGLLVARPARIASDLLAAGTDPEEVGRVITEALRGGFEYRWAFAKLLAPHAARLGHRRGDGVAAMYRLIGARRRSGSPRRPPPGPRSPARRSVQMGQVLVR